MDKTSLATDAIIPDVQPSIDLARQALEDHISTGYLLTHGNWTLEDVPVHDNDPIPYGDPSTTQLTGNRISRKSFVVVSNGQRWRIPADPSSSGPPRLPIVVIQPPNTEGNNWCHLAITAEFTASAPATIEWQGWVQTYPGGPVAWNTLLFSNPGLDGPNHWGFTIDVGSQDLPKAGVYQLGIGTNVQTGVLNQPVTGAVSGDGIQTFTTTIYLNCGIQSGHSKTKYTNVLQVRCLVSNAEIGGATVITQTAGLSLYDTAGRYLCTYAGIRGSEMDAMFNLRDWVKANHPEDSQEYLKKAPALVAKISHSPEEVKLRLGPSIQLAVDGQFEESWKSYAAVARTLWKETFKEGQT